MDAKKNLFHVALIPDGNRRWARERNLPTFEGHRRGFDNIIKISSRARDLGIKIFTLWAFSTENWKRTKEEVGYLMKLYEQTIDVKLKQALQERTRIVHLGRKDRMPETLRKKIANAEEKTQNFDSYFFVVALDYGGRDEIVRAVQKMQGARSDTSQIQENDIDHYLDTKSLPHPNPDLIIRTSGENRVSGFMLWQSAYAEYMFVKKHCPDFLADDFEECVKEFEKRNRRFGK
ncbi:MAG: polyprenyl diphosphate synthase [Patescibacteria group bacterium]